MEKMMEYLKEVTKDLDVMIEKRKLISQKEGSGD